MTIPRERKSPLQRRRILLLVIALVASFAAISARLIWLQGIEWRTYQHAAERTHRRVWAEPAPRGRILDRTGRVIAQDVPSHEVVYTLDEIEKVRWVCRRVHRALRSDPSGASLPHDAEELWTSLQRFREGVRADLTAPTAAPPLPWISGVPREAAEALALAIRRRPASFPGVVVPPGEGRIDIAPHALFEGERTVRLLARRLGRDPDELWASVWRRYEQVQDVSLPSARREEIYRILEHRLVGDLPDELVEELLLFPDRFPGLRVRETPRREFSGPAGIARLTGRVGARRPSDQDRWEEAREPIVDRHRFRSLQPVRLLQERSHHSEDLVGHDGIEASREERLRGRAGGALWIVDHRQSPRGEPLDLEPPRPGADLELQLDLELCEELGRLTARRDPWAASILVADARSGAILGWESYPAATPDVFEDQDEYRRLVEEERGHFYDRPAAYPIDPGSTFKVLVSLAALEEGVIDPAHTEVCDGAYDPARPGRLRCANHYRGLELDIEEALERSCNVFFYRVGGDRLGLRRMVDWARRFGFWQRVELGIGSQAVGLAPRASPPSVAIGRSFTTTPLQMLRFVTIVANRGVDPGLSLIKGVHAPPLAVPPLRASSWESVVRGMERAVRSTTGTAGKEKYGLRRFDCAVKTGTASMSRGEVPPRWRAGEDGEEGDWNRAWLIGFAPAENPEVSFAICLERVLGHGGEECAPIAAELLEWLERERGLNLRPRDSDR